MSALPPPRPTFDFAYQGLMIGMVFGAGAAMHLGLVAIIYPIVGLILGIIFDQRPAH